MIDSCTMQFPFDVCKRFSFNQMIHSPKTLENQVISDTYQAPLNKLPIGISSIKVDWKNKFVLIDASAKVLGDNYLHGITQNTFAQIIDSVNHSGYIHLDANGCFDLGRFNKIDTTNNVNMGGYDKDFVEHWDEIYPHLTNSINNRHFKATAYTHKSNKGIAFVGDQITEKNRLIAYCKSVELMTAKNNDFMRSLSLPNQMMNNAKDLLRIECNHTSFKSIKSRLRISDTQIKNVLINGQNPNVLLLDKITKPDKVNQLILFLDEYNPESYNFEEVIKNEGIKNIIRKANYCEMTLTNIIKSYNCNFKYYWYGDKRKKGFIGIQKLIPYFRTLDTFQDDTKPMTNELITYIRNEMMKAS